MSILAEIERAIEKLPREDLFQLTGWLSTHFSDAWDRQIEKAIAEHGAWPDRASGG